MGPIRIHKEARQLSRRSSRILLAWPDTPASVCGCWWMIRLTEDDLSTRRVPEEEIVCLAARVGKSTTARGWLGALVGALASLPFGISVVGDMVMPAAIAGALIAGNTGQPRARVLLDRSHIAAIGRGCPASLRVRSAGARWTNISVASWSTASAGAAIASRI